MLKKVAFGIIGFLIILTIFSYFFIGIKYALAFFMITITIIIFSITTWLNDRYYNEQISKRVYSIPNRAAINDVILKQMNMLRADKHIVAEDKHEFYKNNHLMAKVEFQKDENGNILQIDGKYIIEVEAPEYILHNIDQEIWSLVGRATK
ncbi:hypothetical protein JCM14244_13390 [Venenivibrio stagnispumantis]|uniref:Uncharacterized protein n=1 Tax=Venenivibrio stagnispumantis TaxID=407998 RepID=A0AA46ADX2_9AQUI|nr:hypothetical protein [Venenivibrio stagnispumantis]MCW4573119.1 hypothetical protein [Venenivibrio stagnispumantis]SMP08870.1 hypothetical protein SAMN06264868_10657 [Venenivibrio stagnispumantis]